METPSGPIGASLLGLERLLADSPSFQRRGGWHGADEARKGIHLFESFEDDPADLHNRRPFAAIWIADAGDLAQFAGGSKIFLEPSGELVLMLTDKDRHPGSARTGGLDFIAWIDGVLGDLDRQSGVSDRLPIRAMPWLLAPRRSARRDEPSTGAYWDCAKLIRWS